MALLPDNFWQNVYSSANPGEANQQSSVLDQYAQTNLIQNGMLTPEGEAAVPNSLQRTDKIDEITNELLTGKFNENKEGEEGYGGISLDTGLSESLKRIEEGYKTGGNFNTVLPDATNVKLPEELTQEIEEDIEDIEIDEEEIEEEGFDKKAMAKGLRKMGKNIVDKEYKIEGLFGRSNLFNGNSRGGIKF